jgi:hypothetical protein
VPISKKLQFMVFVFVCMFFAVLELVFLCSGFSSAARRMCKGKGVGPRIPFPFRWATAWHASTWKSQSLIKQQFTLDSGKEKSPTRTFPE